MIAMQRNVSVVRLGVVVAIVLGILGMHALSLCCTPCSAATSGPTGATTGHHHAPAATADSTPSIDPASSDSEESGLSLSDIVMLCMAMLAGAAFVRGLLAVLRVDRFGAVLRTAAACFRPTSWLSPIGTGPPPAWQFSVIRC